MCWSPGLKSGAGFGAGLVDGPEGFGPSDGLAAGGLPEGRPALTFPEGLLPEGLPAEGLFEAGFLSAGLISGFGRFALSGLDAAGALSPEGRPEVTLPEGLLSSDGLPAAGLSADGLLADGLSAGRADCELPLDAEGGVFADEDLVGVDFLADSEEERDTEPEDDLEVEPDDDLDTEPDDVREVDDDLEVPLD